MTHDPENEQRQWYLVEVTHEADGDDAAYVSQHIWYPVFKGQVEAWKRLGHRVTPVMMICKEELTAAATHIAELEAERDALKAQLRKESEGK